MTTSYKKRRNRKILALFLSSIMLTAAGALTACGGGGDSSVDDSEQTYTEPDNARIANGSFEFFDDGDGKNLIITSPTSWSRSNGSSAQGTASTSRTASGIVDTSVEAWENLTASSDLPPCHRGGSRGKLGQTDRERQAGILRYLGRGKRRR